MLECPAPQIRNPKSTIRNRNGEVGIRFAARLRRVEPSERRFATPRVLAPVPGQAGWKTESRRIRNGEVGIRTRDTDLTPYNGLANRRFQPLSHLSKMQRVMEAGPVLVDYMARRRRRQPRLLPRR